MTPLMPFAVAGPNLPLPTIPPLPLPYGPQSPLPLPWPQPPSSPQPVFGRAHNRHASLRANCKSLQSGHIQSPFATVCGFPPPPPFPLPLPPLPSSPASPFPNALQAAADPFSNADPHPDPQASSPLPDAPQPSSPLPKAGAPPQACIAPF